MDPWTLAGQGIQAFGSLYAGAGQSSSLKAQARSKEVEALATRERGLWESMRLNEERRRTLATQRELYGSAGVTLEGAPENIMRETKQEFVLDRLMLGRNTAQAVSALQADAAALRSAARRAMTGGLFGAFGSFFSG